MPCQTAKHAHSWPEKGQLIIEKCERFCGYCEDEYAEHEWKFAWFLRRHVKTVHCKEGADHPDVVVQDNWTGMPVRKQPRLPPRKKKTSTGNASKVKKTPKTPSPRRRARASSSPSFDGVLNLGSPWNGFDEEKAISQSPTSHDGEEAIPRTPDFSDSNLYEELSAVLYDPDLYEEQQPISQEPKLYEEMGSTMKNPYCYDGEADLFEELFEESSSSCDEEEVFSPSPPFNELVESIKHAFVVAVQDLTNQGDYHGLSIRDMVSMLTGEACRLLETSRAVEQRAAAKTTELEWQL